MHAVVVCKKREQFALAPSERFARNRVQASLSTSLRGQRSVSFNAFPSLHPSIFATASNQRTNGCGKINPGDQNDSKMA